MTANNDALLQMVAEMKNFADVADRCELTEGNAPAAIRSWADRLRALSADRGEAVAVDDAYDEWCGAHTTRIEVAHPRDIFVAGYRAATPPSPAESAERKCYCPACKEIRSAAPSGVSDAMVDSAARALCQRFAAECGGDAPDAWAKLSQHFKDDARAALEASQPQPGRVEGKS